MPVSLRASVEQLLRRWEQERSAAVAARDDTTVPPQLRDASARAAERLGECIEDLDVTLDRYVRG